MIKKCPRCDLNYLEGEQVVCSVCNPPAPLKNQKSKSIRNNPKKGSNEIRYIIKPMGYSGTPYSGDGFPSKLNFAKQPKSVSIGDVLIGYSVSNGRLVGYYKVDSDPIEDMRDDYIGRRWPWCVEAENLSPEYSKKWKNSTLFLTGLEKEFLKKQPNGLVTFIGGKTLGALNFGADKIRLDIEFAKYMIDKIDNYT